MEILLFIFFLLVFIGLLIGGYVIKSIKKFKKAVEQEADRREQQFRSEIGRKNQQYSQRNTRNTQRTYHTEQPHRTEQSQTQEEPFFQEKSYQTQTGETIIDQHHKERESRKIFDDEDGEYVEFTEEK